MRPRRLIEAKRHPRLMQRLADQVASLRRHMVIHLAKNHDQLALDVFNALQRVVALARAERRAVDVCRKIAHCGADAGVQGAAVREVPAQTHTWLL